MQQALWLVLHCMLGVHLQKPKYEIRVSTEESLK